MEEKIHNNELPELIKEENELNSALIYISNRFKNILSFEKNNYIYNKLEVFSLIIYLLIIINFTF